MLTLGTESVRDYQACELFYELRYLHQEREPVEGRSMLQRRYDDSLRKVAAFYFYRRQSGLAPSYNALLKRWEKIWFPKDMDAYDIAVEQHTSISNFASYASSASMALLRFYETFSGATNFGDPISIDQQFLVSLDRDVRLQGTYDLVLTKRYEHRVVMWWTRSRVPPIDQLALDFSALKYAYEWDRGRDWQGMSISYWLYNLASPSAALTRVDINGDDVAQFIYWARRARDTDTFVPRRGLSTYCRGCPFDSLCIGWKKWPR
jgi:PD-(D/E)XK nuclease superfamily protein